MFTVDHIGRRHDARRVHIRQPVGVPLSTVVGSNEITIAGINTNAIVSITGGEYSIDDGAFTAAAGNVANNQRIRVRRELPPPSFRLRSARS